MLTQSDILALGPQIEVKLAGIRADIAKLSQEITGDIDYSSETYIGTHKKLRARENRKAGLEKLQKLVASYVDSHTILSGKSTDAELITLATEELALIEPEIRELYLSFMSETAKFQNVVMEIRAGAGGDEATLFAQEIFRMYQLFGASRGWKVELTDTELSEKGGFRHADAYIEGDDAYFWLQYESGVHRVQRVPETESSGRIHTSTISVAILPEVEDVDVKINPNDVVMEAYRSSGPGGQSVNKTSSAVRLRHVPTGIVVTSQVERSQLKNRDAAMRQLKSRIYQAQQEAQDKELGDIRRGQIGTGDRSEKIRTYNFPQSRVTDHRVKKSWFNIAGIMEGDIETLLTDVRTLLTETGIQTDASDEE
ncbi:MAG: PCRF domain-containing protein [Candidatus Dojkabacteria bacterium]|nr:MAG: PCRF domain-containing protein [Candidatus Dojkabacteria bacterium]